MPKPGWLQILAVGLQERPGFGPALDVLRFDRKPDRIQRPVADDPVVRRAGRLVRVQLVICRSRRGSLAGIQVAIRLTLGQISNRRSEEHTSELQSLAYLVCRLLLEKKKNIVLVDVQ